MGKATLVLTAASRWPALGNAAVHIWGACHRGSRQQPHWLFTALKAKTGARIRRQFILPGGEKISADPFEYVGARLGGNTYYDPEVVAIFRSLVKPGMVVADIGANIGHHSVVLAGLVGLQGAVHAFEPDPKVFRELIYNAELNHHANLHCVNLALSSEPGDATLYLGVEGGQNSLQPTIHYGDRQIVVRTETFDAYAEQHGLPRLDLMKIDVEGAELPVLRGAAASLDKFRPILILEFSVHSAAFGYSHRELRIYLERLGYQFFEVDVPPLHPLGEEIPHPVFFNVLAVPGSKVASLAADGILIAEGQRESGAKQPSALAYR